MWFSRRTYIAGELPNTAENLVRWVQSPTSVEPKTAMPVLGLSNQQARDVAAYLYTLR
jgi:cytochrome c1